MNQPIKTQEKSSKLLAIANDSENLIIKTLGTSVIKTAQCPLPPWIKCSLIAIRYLLDFFFEGKKL